MDAFNERLSRLAELSTEELDALIGEMVEAFDQADESGDIQAMQEIADALDTARAERTSRGEDAPEAEATPEETNEPAVAASATVTDEPEAEVAETPADDTPTEAEAVAEAEAITEAAASADAPTDQADAPEAEASDAEAPEAEALESEATAKDLDSSGADAPQAEESQMDEPVTADDVPEENQPTAAPEPAVTIRAGGDVPGITAGAELQDYDEVVEAMTRKVNSMRGVSGDGEHIIVASLATESDIPEERTLRAGDAAGNARKVRQLLEDQDALQAEALTAAGWCAPRAPIYDVPTVGTTDRPVASGLPTFNADRGGVTWMQPPALPSVTDAVALWTYDEEDARWESRTVADGSGTTATTKPSLTVTCGTEQNKDVDAVTVSLCFDNMTSRAFPEWIRANTDLTMVQQARFAEQALLAGIFSAVADGGCGSPASTLGAARDWLTTVKTAASAKRWQFRLGKDAPLQVLAPEWLCDAVALDLSLQAPGDDKLDAARDEVNGYLATHNITPIWFQDDVPGQDAFDACSAFPTDAHWMLFPTGTFVRLDNGVLDLGVVRSKTDVAANQYCQFAETFEVVAYMGPASPNEWATHGVTPINLLGRTGGPIEVLAS